LRARLVPLLALLAASAAVVIALYGRALDYELVWMDQTEIAQGAIVLAPGAGWSSAFTRPLHASAQGANPYYRPLQILTATAVHRVAGPRPAAYRVVLLAAAIATCFAFGALALHLFGNLPLALATTVFAAAHPAMIESWVWISGLGEALAGCFVLASVAAGVLALERGGRARTLWSAASIAALALALLSKEKAVVAPLLVAAWWLARALSRGGLRATAGDRAPILLVGAQLALVAVYLVARPLLMGRGPVAAVPIGGDRATHLLSALAAWPASLGWLALPLHSTASDGVDVVRSIADARVWLGVALPIVSIAAAWILARRGRPVAAFGIAWIWIAFAPTANLLPQIHAHAERYLFLSVFGLALVAGDLADALSRRIGARALGAALVLVAALGLAQRTWVRTPAWQSDESLFRADLARDPAWREGRFHLVTGLVAKGRLMEADLELRKLREPAPGDRSGYVNAFGVEQVACAVAFGLGRHGEVIARFDALERESSPLAADPGLRSCVAQSLEALGRNAQAAALYERVVESLGGAEPPAALSLSLARVLAKSGRRDDARQWLDRARASAGADPAFGIQAQSVERLLR
jgi:hypothetical protein